MTKSLFLWLLVCGLSVAPYARAQPAEHPPETKPVTLTDKLPTASFPLSSEIVAKGPPILALTITKVTNPERFGINLFVYLSSTQGSQSQKILIGNVSLYPSDHPAGFLLRSSTAFQQLQVQGAPSKSSRVALLIEMKPVHQGEPWKPIELVVAPPEWRKE